MSTMWSWYRNLTRHEKYLVFFLLLLILMLVLSWSWVSDGFEEGLAKLRIIERK